MCARKYELVSEDDRDRDSGSVRRFPEQHSAERVAAQKRMAQDLIVQMMPDPRERRQVLKYMAELIDWQENDNGGGGD